MKVHIIIDFTYLYYKYKYTIENNKIRRFKIDLHKMDEDGNAYTEEFETSYVYYPLKEIEGFRKQFLKEGHNVKVSVCFDAPSMRKEVDHEYKSNRVNKLSDEDFDRINMIREMLTVAGYNTYFIPGYEADDIIANILNQYEDDFDFNVVYTPDMDLMVHVNDKVGVMRFKVFKGYTAVNKKNYSSYCSNEYKCTIPYNGLLMYKILCGDKSDVIAGIKGFGPAAFDKFVDYLGDSIDWEQAGNIEYVQNILEENKGYFKSDALPQIQKSLDMVKYIPIEGVIDISKGESTEESRTEAYMPLMMGSLV